MRASLPLALLALGTLVGCSADEPAGPSDEEGPTLLSLAFTPDRVQARATGSVTAEVRIGAQDPSGVAGVEVTIGLPGGGSETCSAELLQGSVAEGTWHCPVVVGPDDSAGEWRVHEVLLEDTEGNEARPEVPTSGSILTVVGPGEEDLTIRFIERLPRMEWVQESPDPARDGWPEEGEEVEWVAHVRNWSPASVDVGYEWQLDGEPVKSGVMTVPGDTLATTALEWSWTFDRHELRFVLDGDDEIAESEEDNNSLEIYTDALSVGFYVEHPLAEAFREIQPTIEAVDATSFEDWAHRHIERYNQIAADAIYPETPEGVLDRWRLDRLEFVPEGTLQGSRRPVDDRTVDLMWGFPASVEPIYRNLAGSGSGGPNFYNGTLIHELGHARYLVDVYGTRVFSGLPGHRIEITEGGEPLLGQGFFSDEQFITLIHNGETFEGWFIRGPVMEGLMSMDYTYIDRYSAAALNLIAGHRATSGNYNAPSNLGIFMHDLPADTRLRVVDAATDDPLTGASVSFFRSEPVFESSPSYGREIDDIPELEVTTDSEGLASLGRAPFEDGDARMRVHSSVAVIRVEHEDRVGYGILDSTLLNLAFWGGETDVHVREFPVTLH